MISPVQSHYYADSPNSLALLKLVKICDFLTILKIRIIRIIELCSVAWSQYNCWSVLEVS